MSATAGTDPPEQTLDWVLRALGGRRLVAVRAVRVSSTAVHVVEVEQPGGATAAFALRRFVDAQRLRDDPWYVPAHEAAALELLGTTPVPAPRLVAADVDAAACDVPTLLTTCLSGRPGGEGGEQVTDGMMVELAGALSTIHAVRGARERGLPSYAPYRAPGEVGVPAWTQQPGTWRRAVELLAGEPPGTEVRFVHRDFHPGNTLWTGGRLGGVVDWTTACLGPPGIDLARMRQNLALTGGPEAAERFLRVYVRETGRAGDHHPWWDVLDAVDMLADTPAPVGAREVERLRRWESYVALAVAELSGHAA